MTWNLKQFFNSLSLPELGIGKYMEECNFKKTNFSDGAVCDYCTNPTEPSFAQGSDDDWFWICGKCAESEIRRGNKGVQQHKIKLEPHGNLPF